MAIPVLILAAAAAARVAFGAAWHPVDTLRPPA
jgi:hypothetical protein